MTPSLAVLALKALPYVFWTTAWVVLYLWLRRELTPARVLSLFESENSLSIRLVLATVVVVFTLCMQAAGRMNALVVEANYTFAAVLLGLGAAKIVGKAFAHRPPDTTVNTKKTELTAENVSLNTTESIPPGGPKIN